MNVTIETAETTNHIIIRVTGPYGFGSAGNVDAKAMRETLREAVDQAGSRRVVLDMSEMTYEFGDGVGSVFHPFVDENVHYLLNQDCAPAWKGLFDLVGPEWMGRFGNRIRFGS